MDTWRMKDGTRVLIRHMTDRHLANAIRMIERGYDKDGAKVSPETLKRGLPALRAEQERRRTEPPTSEELDARMAGEMAEVVWWAARLTSSSGGSTPSGRRS